VRIVELHGDGARQILQWPAFGDVLAEQILQ
jgi:hypothetical protein